MVLTPPTSTCSVHCSQRVPAHTNHCPPVLTSREGSLQLSPGYGSAWAGGTATRDRANTAPNKSDATAAAADNLFIPLPVPATACLCTVGVRTGRSYRALDNNISATAGNGMGMVDGLVTIPGNAHAIRTRGKQLAVVGAFNPSTLSHNPRFGLRLAHTPGEFDLLMARRVGRRDPFCGCVGRRCREI